MVVFYGSLPQLIAVTPSGVDQPLRHASSVLVDLGLLSLFVCVAMLMRTGMAKGSGEPVPDDPSADVLTRTGRFIARGETSRVRFIAVCGNCSLGWQSFCSSWASCSCWLGTYESQRIAPRSGERGDFRRFSKSLR